PARHRAADRNLLLTAVRAGTGAGHRSCGRSARGLQHRQHAMTPWLADLAAWWRSGDVFMPVMLATSLTLYTLIGERIWGLWLEPPPLLPRRDDGGVAALQDRRELTRGFAIIRALTLSLPL